MRQRAIPILLAVAALVGCAARALKELPPEHLP